jgi:menaquinone-specific isochorismate synthase
MEEDRLLAETLFDSHKEREEHRFVIDQIRRKLEPIMPELGIPHEPHILKLKNVQHLRTPISGKLKNGENVLDLVQLLHPTPAVAGTPTNHAMAVIRKLEPHDRGWYSGPVGWIDPKGDGDFFVALRSALVKEGESHVFAGGGIVSESLPDQEWLETELKLQPIITALSGGQV